VDAVFGLAGLLVFIVCVISVAAGVTWLVVKVSPNPEDKRKKEEQPA
jgi:hypothetical protein